MVWQQKDKWITDSVGLKLIVITTLFVKMFFTFWQSFPLFSVFICMSALDCSAVWCVGVKTTKGCKNAPISWHKCRNQTSEAHLLLNDLIAVHIDLESNMNFLLLFCVNPPKPPRVISHRGLRNKDTFTDDLYLFPSACSNLRFSVLYYWSSLCKNWL